MFLILFPWYWTLPSIIAFTMVQGVQTESTTKIIISCLANFGIIGFIVSIFASYKLHEKISLKYAIVVPTVTSLISIASIGNSLLCLSNFGKYLKIYLNYQSDLTDYDYNGDLDKIFENNENNENNSKKLMEPCVV
ncbi:hypothetical protein F8M41_006599 [Gigaspora margarita]|uniref:Uncharacterized protein n=1 Tax=Gigaspora margarita TaxID=4874 RepID=A0A8H4ERG3_GIGMA|nr:hypothetical protein F8M41_006599 [Gigaspora margarita]